jgi:hypothetical protein
MHDTLEYRSTTNVAHAFQFLPGMIRTWLESNLNLSVAAKLLKLLAWTICGLEDQNTQNEQYFFSLFLALPFILAFMD